MTNIASNDYGTVSGVVVIPNEWHQVAVVLTSTSSPLYLDVAVYSRNVTSPVYDFSTLKLYIWWVQYHPNPFALHTTVRVEGSFGYQLFDVQGAMLAKGEAVNQLVIGDSLEKGVYMLKITQGPRSKTLKLIKM